MPALITSFTSSRTGSGSIDVHPWDTSLASLYVEIAVSLVLTKIYSLLWLLTPLGLLTTSFSNRFVILVYVGVRPSFYNFASWPTRGLQIRVQLGQKFLGLCFLDPLYFLRCLGLRTVGSTHQDLVFVKLKVPAGALWLQEEVGCPAIFLLRGRWELMKW